MAQRGLQGSKDNQADNNRDGSPAPPLATLGAIPGTVPAQFREAETIIILLSQMGN